MITIVLRNAVAKNAFHKQKQKHLAHTEQLLNFLFTNLQSASIQGKGGKCSLFTDYMPSFQWGKLECVSTTAEFVPSLCRESQLLRCTLQAVQSLKNSFETKVIHTFGYNSLHGYMYRETFLKAGGIPTYSCNRIFYCSLCPFTGITPQRHTHKKFINCVRITVSNIKAVVWCKCSAAVNFNASDYYLNRDVPHNSVFKATEKT